MVELAETEAQIRKKIASLLGGQLLAVLSSQRCGQPYGSLIAFVHSEDLAHLYFATPKATRKFANLMAEPRVSLLVDSRSNKEIDFHQAEAVTIIGEAGLVGEVELEQVRALYLDRHPSLKDFILSPSTAFFQVVVKHYILVDRFQHVVELHLTDELDMFNK